MHRSSDRFLGSVDLWDDALLRKGQLASAYHANTQGTHRQLIIPEDKLGAVDVHKPFAKLGKPSNLGFYCGHRVLG